MFKYVIWVIRIIIPLMWNYFTWMLPYSRHPERYPAKLRHAKGRRLARRVLKAMRVDVELRNVPKIKEGEVYFFAGNHTSLLDAVITLAYTPAPIYYVSKIENRKTPFVIETLRGVGGLLIERDNLKQEIKVLGQIRESLAAKETSWLVFPEGTRNKNYHSPLLPYKAGTFKAPMQTNTTIIPFVINGSNVILPTKISARRYKVVYEFLDPIIPEGNTIDLANQIYEKSNALNIKLKEEYAKTQKLNKYGRDFIDPTKHQSN